jgi:hypothetical protein
MLGEIGRSQIEAGIAQELGTCERPCPSTFNFAKSPLSNHSQGSNHQLRRFSARN